MNQNEENIDDTLELESDSYEEPTLVAKDNYDYDLAMAISTSLNYDTTIFPPQEIEELFVWQVNFILKICDNDR